MSIDPTSALGFGSFQPAQFSSATGPASSTSAADFGSMVAQGVDRLEKTQDKADQLAASAATGNLDDIHDYTLAASEAQVTTQLTVALRNKAVEAFTEIMRMNV